MRAAMAVMQLGMGQGHMHAPRVQAGACMSTQVPRCQGAKAAPPLQPPKNRITQSTQQAWHSRLPGYACACLVLIHAQQHLQAAQPLA